MEPEPLSHQIVDKIRDIIKRNFGTEVLYVELNSMFRLYVNKKLKGKCRYLYWVDFNSKKWPKGLGIRVHLQKIKEYTGKDYPNDEGRLDASIAFKNSGYPCFIIRSQKDLDDFFERTIKLTYESLVIP